MTVGTNRCRQLVEHLSHQTRPVTIAEIADALGRSHHRVINAVSQANLRLYVRRTNKGEKFATYIITTMGRQALKDPEAFRDPRGSSSQRPKPVPVAPVTAKAIVESALRSRPPLVMAWGASP